MSHMEPKGRVVKMSLILSGKYQVLRLSNNIVQLIL